MAATMRALVIRSSRPDVSARFWGDLLGWPMESSRHGLALIPDAETPFGLRFVASDEPQHQPKHGPNQIHFHLTSNDAAQDTTVARALELGATHVDVGQLPEEGHVVLADPDGNEFCVIEAGNNWLAGTGFLGELAADGTREVGLFWSAAIGWPLVWDQDGETAIEPPEGGFKIAWGGPPLNDYVGRHRMYAELVTDDLDTEVARLVGLGATVVGPPEQRRGRRRAADVELADPDGNEFHLTTG